jgi:hypothetical protein
VSTITLTDSLKEVIQKAVTVQILYYRVNHIPTITEKDKTFLLEGQKYEKTAQSILLPSTGSSDASLLLNIQPWPLNDPWPDYYLITKSSNLFILPNDTLAVKEYDQYNKYFPDDDRFLVYYDAKNEYLVNISGNFNQDRATALWFKGGNINMIKMRLAQYNATIPYDNIIVKDTIYYLMNPCNLIKNYSGKFIVKMVKPIKSDNWEIIYYSNKEAITGDSNNQHFYEVKYIRKFFFGDPKPVTSSKPLLRLIDIPERDALEKLYRTIPYVFGDIDMNAFK